MQRGPACSLPVAAGSPAHPGWQADRRRRADAAAAPPACASRLRWSVGVRCSCWLSLYYGCVVGGCDAWGCDGDGCDVAGCGICTGGGCSADGGTGETGLSTMPERALSIEMPKRVSV